MLWDAFDPAPIRAAAKMSESLREALLTEPEGKIYLAGAGVAVGGEDFLEIALRRSYKSDSRIVPIEAVAFASMRILEKYVGVNDTGCGNTRRVVHVRIMLYPGGIRFGQQAILEAWRTAISDLVGALDDPGKIRKTLIG